ncbi:uncharacterized protein EDB91DRAFT_1110458 [Suillus paluster]|uniref:uncharacterized protein n=1 Tax=Suillus paluster TaxID=48578 RepID=UPI001B871585|nr:uncharacterized protein EDB91DRAFT_1110458 [Suillus paluster]KAG1749933.1 hypothetical protein EDB91DRAFT_1110458 [Suillus paluster]
MVLPPSDLENDIANSVDKLQRLYPDTFDAKRYLYLPHGKYAFAAEHTFQGKNKKQLGLRSGHGYRIYARNGVIAGHNVTCLWKTWNVSKAWREFFQELYFYSHPKLLRWLQGIIVPHVIGVHDEPNGQKSVFMEPPHHTFWHTAHADLSIGEKQAIIRAYEALHEHGIMHNNISAHNICIDQDMNVTLLNFERARCLNDKGMDEVPGCDQEALKQEMRQVKYLIDYMGARFIESEILTAPETPPGEQQTEPLCILDVIRWLSDAENTHIIPSDMRNRPLPNDGRGRAKKPTVKAGAIGQRGSAEPMQDAVRSGSWSEPIVPPILLPTLQPSSSAISTTASPPLDSPADIRGFLPLDHLPFSNRHDALPSTCFEEGPSETQDIDTSVQPPLPSGSDSGRSRTISSSSHDVAVYSSSVSPLTPPPSLLPSTLSPISDISAQIPQIPPSRLLSAHLASRASPDHCQSRTFVQLSDQLPSPKVFCDLTHEQLRLAIKQHNAVVDARLSSQHAIITDKNNVVFHPDTNDNGIYATGSDPFRKRKKRRRPTPFLPEGSSSTEDETIPNEDEEDEEPEPQIEVDFEELVEEAHLARLRGRRRISRPSMLPAMVLAKSMRPDPEAKSPAIAKRSTCMPPSAALSSIGEESPGDTSGAPPYSVVFVGANGCPEEVWKLPVPAFMLVKSSVARQPQAQKFRIEQAPRLRGPPLTNSSSSRVTNQDTQSRSSKKRKIDCVEGIEYLEQTSKRTRQDQSTPSSCIIC